MYVNLLRHFVLLSAASVLAAGCTLLPFGDEEEAPVPVTSTYLCAEGRTFNASFDPGGRRAAVMMEGGNYLLYRLKDTNDPAVFTNGILSLHARHRPEPEIWLERSGLVIYRSCLQEAGEG